MTGSANPFSTVPVAITPESYVADGLSRRIGGALSPEEILRGGVSADDLYRGYPEEGMRFYRGMRVERGADGRLQILEQRPTEINGERLQSNILNFSQDPRQAQHFAMMPGSEAVSGNTPILLETRPITREEATRYFHGDNFNPSIFQDGLSTTDKWDMHADTRLPDVVQRVQVFEDGQWRPARPDEVAWRPRPGARTDGVDGARPDAGPEGRPTGGDGTARTTAGDAGGASGFLFLNS